MNLPVVSIVTPTFNHARYIQQCVRSVQGQSFIDWEQIVIDDGSTDETVPLVEQIADSRVKIIRQENQGLENLGTTYNRALTEAKGSLIAILEGDDFWPSGFLAGIVPAFGDSEVVLAYGRTQMCTDDGDMLNRFIPTVATEARIGTAGLSNNPVGAAADAMCRPEVTTFTFPCSTLLRRRPLEEIGGFQQVDGLPFTDFPTFLRMAFKGRFSYHPEAGGIWRQRLFSGTRIRDEIAVFDRILTYAQETFDIQRPGSAHQLPSNEGLQQRWAARHGRMRFDVGRRRLFLNQWPEARREFGKALFTGQTPLKVRIASAAGLFAATAHLPFEPLALRYLGLDHDMRRVFLPDRN